MKIYVDNINLTDLKSIQESLSDLLINTQKYTEVYTNNGIYNIDNKNIFLLEPNDGEINVFNNYFNDITLIVDNSYFEKIIETSIIGSVHIHNKILKQIYRLNPKSKINFIIEIVDNIKHTIYFESEDKIDIKELFNKQEIIEFLSLLN
jgi:hypothetical protein